MAILTINSGSSSLKASLFRPDGTRLNFRYEHIGHGFPHDHLEAFNALLEKLGDERPTAVGHRFVHGGEVTDSIRKLDSDEISRLEGITNLAPLHMPGNLLGVRISRQHFGDAQFACFDTAFHQTLPEISRRLPIPQAIGLRRFGFHGINYAHVARRLPELIGDIAYGRVVAAHLGSGSSLCLLENLKSIDTSMGFSPAGGIPMGTRSGDLDPGVMLELAKRYDEDSLRALVYHQMGLLALSDGESNEMSDLIRSNTPSSRFAIDYYARQVRAAIGSYAAKAGGIDALVFTAGIGEHASKVRELTCAPLAFLGLEISQAANESHQMVLNTSASKPILIIPADEEAEIARLTRSAIDRF